MDESAPGDSGDTVNFSSIPGVVARLEAKVAELERRISRVLDGRSQLRLDGNTTVGVIPAHAHAGTGEGGSLFEAPTELTISSGLVTCTQLFHTIDTEGDAASDNLAGANGGADGRLLIIRSVSSARDVVVRHVDAVEAALGQRFYLSTGADTTLDVNTKYIALLYDSTSQYWIELFRSW